VHDDEVVPKPGWRSQRVPLCDVQLD